jgi:hypothetical protein
MAHAGAHAGSARTASITATYAVHMRCPGSWEALLIILLGKQIIKGFDSYSLSCHRTIHAAPAFQVVKGMCLLRGGSSTAAWTSTYKDKAPEEEVRASTCKEAVPKTRMHQRGLLAGLDT